jgi:hypothetical protein
VVQDCEDRVSQLADSGLAYFSFDGRSSPEAKLATYEAFLRSVIDQLCEILPHRFPSIIRKISKTSSNDQLAQCLEGIVACFKCVHFFTDGLDECSEKDRLAMLKWIETASQNPSIGLFVTSQPWPNIISYFNRIPCSREIQINMNETVVESDITRFIEEKVKDNQAWIDEDWKDDKPKIVKALVNAAAGM